MVGAGQARTTASPTRGHPRIAADQGTHGNHGVRPPRVIVEFVFVFVFVEFAFVEFVFVFEFVAFVRRAGHARQSQRALPWKHHDTSEKRARRVGDDSPARLV